MPSDRELFEAHRAHGWDYRTLADIYDLSADSVRGRVGRYRRQHVQTRLEREQGRPLLLPPGEYVITGDYQIDTHDAHFVERMLAVSAQLARPRALIIAGDFINADAFSTYDSDVGLSPFGDEVEAGRAVFARLLSVFGRVVWLMGNHERRVGKRTRTALQPRHLWALLSYDPRVEVSPWGHCVIENPDGHDWRITHGSDYSINQLTVADQMAQKYQQNIISHHEHHLAIGWDRYKRYVIVNNGGLFEQANMPYVVLDDSKRPAMQNGFTVLSWGYPTVYGPEPFTNWARVLKPRQRRAAA